LLRKTDCPSLGYVLSRSTRTYKQNTTNRVYSWCTFWPSCRCRWVRLSETKINKENAGGKHIYAIRDPYDALISHYSFVVPITNISLDKVSLDDYYYKYYSTNVQPTYWQNLASWLKYRYGLN
jgi:hypothetical protein